MVQEILKGRIKSIQEPLWSSKIELVMEYEHVIPHAGISKKGTGPGVGMIIKEIRQLPVKSEDYKRAFELGLVDTGIDVEFLFQGFITPRVKNNVVVAKIKFPDIVREENNKGEKLYTEKEVMQKLHDYCNSFEFPFEDWEKNNITKCYKSIENWWNKNK